MAITLGAFTCSTLLAQPAGNYEADTQAGLTARKWIINGLLTPTQWQSFLSVYNTWRNTRINDADSLQSRTTGTTVNFTGNANGITWTSIPCWFLSAPSGDQAGQYINATVEIVHAAEALQVLLAQEEKNREKSDALLPDLGTLTIGSAVLTLLKPKETYTNIPQLQLTAAGTPYISGPLTATPVYDAEGELTSTGWNNLLSWFASVVQTTPTTGFYPLSPPTASAEGRIVDGAKVTIYRASIQVAVL